MTHAAADATPLPARDAYRLWAPGYHVETAVSALERRAVDEVTPDLTGCALLDAGCGTGRRHAAAGARLVVGIDLVVEMIRAGNVHSEAAGAIHGARAALHAAADVRSIPLHDDLFDVLWCRLVLGHLQDVRPAYAELGRVAADGALLVMTDFHPVAAAAGHTRSFRTAAGTVHSIEHHVHDPDHHVEAARCSGWHIRHRADLCVGAEIRSYYEAAGALDRYDAQFGLPLVLMLVFER